ncbi:small ribosomal subunit Rsm22 family protein [Methylocystis parvus]|uniref:Methyltransferase domain-containing protein n=1 Tax=Methylocystis parvus TaxID=134 RepID=A0A6B8M3U9_9HYPH|nr:small ribosomal subunit Rsm22 family protein [Methylocystis parvus]QGM96103.1 methyltransferase domain-containing protein [Methylocystis parvus]WBK00074.1 small ribosomal subunit Rsm22 family protein [Methylocystis parvus OBBP]
MSALPAGLAAAIAAQLERRPRNALTESARRLSESYRARKNTSEAIRDETDALAYALTRMPATYAAVAAALERLAQEQPAFAPKSLIDVGCGLGAAAYAAAAVWPKLERIEMVDRSRAFLALAAALAAESGAAPVAGATITPLDITRLPPAGAKADLVVLAYALTELSEADLPPLADALWARAGGALVIVEPGTPRDHERLMRVRAQLIERGATILLPCPHDRPCPLEPPDWCHFSVRLPRSREHKLLKGADAPFEDEKYAYLVAARFGEGAQARILAPARRNKAGVTLKLCETRGMREIFLPKRDKARYEGIWKKDWGDALAAPPEDAG